jgi:hypothetical protein
MLLRKSNIKLPNDTSPHSKRPLTWTPQLQNGNHFYDAQLSPLNLQQRYAFSLYRRYSECPHTEPKTQIQAIHDIFIIQTSWLISYKDIVVYSCCSHLEHGASVKRFVSLQFLNLRHSEGLLGRVISPSQGRYQTQTQNKRTQTSMPWVRFEPTIPAFERAKTVWHSDRPR